MRVLIAPDSFKGSLTSVAVAQALARGWHRARPDDEVRIAPLADGGEGTLVAVEAAGGWQWRDAEAHDPLGRPIRARWLARDDGAVAFVEMATASGLVARRRRTSATPPGRRARARATSCGRCSTRGSATSRSGSAAARRPTAARGCSGRSARACRDDLTAVDLAGLDPRLAETRLRIACDVTNPLLGERGAAATYGPQKGATPDDVPVLDARLARFADALDAATGRSERAHRRARAPRAASASGCCALADRFASLTLEPGIDLVMAVTGFDEALASADLVITGEGRIDEQTAFGKTALGVAQRAQAAGTPCLAVGGGVTPEGIDALATVGAVAVPVTETPQSIEAAMAAGAGAARAVRRAPRAAVHS